MLRFLTAGESHGKGLTAILDGMPSGLAIDMAKIDKEMFSRQQGYGRGARQKIEKDKVEIIGGIRHGITTGGPISLFIENRDWDNWQYVMAQLPIDQTLPEAVAQLKKKEIVRFRPGHADLAGTLKFRQRDLRDVLERSSARETAARVAVGSICLELLSACGIKVAAQVTAMGGIKAKDSSQAPDLKALEEEVLASEMFCADKEATEKMKELIKAKWQEGDSLGGIVEVLADGLPIGLGSYTQWDRRLDGELAQALLSVQAFKACEIGDGIKAASLPGSEVHDALYPRKADNAGLPFSRRTNHAGGIEGGVTNGSRLVVRAFMKPLPTLRKGLASLSFPNFDPGTAHFERSDVCAIAAASVVSKAMVAFVLSRALLDKFGGDTLYDLKAAIERFAKYCREPGSGTLRHSGNTSQSDFTQEAELE